MNTCPTCGRPVGATFVALAYPSRSIAVDGEIIRLTTTEMKIMELLYRAMQRGQGPVDQDHIINALYDLDEPEWPNRILRTFLCRLRKKLAGTNLSILNHYDYGYSLVYEARRAA